ncbi:MULTISPECIES: LCP family protein [Sutcliffiella]|uniref:LCP family glycopolymer transferase n=1 Tax=Sutcliffiella TaxID=2837511 RepID=UPI0022DE0A1A|nr:MULTISPECIES: LCP family protein [Sutcliffiella]MED4014494.1 LCP family protein [Sutcliffiella cohnii]WBL14555.1 LCP family protein [Sutcliffiella sp. NC1]
MIKKLKSLKKWQKYTFLIIGVLFLGVGSMVGYAFYNVNKTLSTMHQPIEREYSDKRPEKVNFIEQDPISILLIGVDSRNGNLERGLSDTLMVITVNPDDKSMKMVSIPRDTRTEIVGKGFEDKINHAHSFGGVEMAIPTVENFLDIPIDYYVKINMEGFKDLVDAVGGVEVNNSFAFSTGGMDFPEGKISLNGKEALAFSRMRKQDPRGDFGRTDRQKQIVQAVIKKGASFSGITNLDSILNAIGQNVKTDIASTEMLDIQKNYKEAINDLEVLQITGTGTTISRIYYLQVPEEERLRISTILKEHLKLNE